MKALSSATARVTLASSAPAHVMLSALGGSLSEGLRVVAPTVDGRVGGLLRRLLLAPSRCHASMGPEGCSRRARHGGRGRASTRRAPSELGQLSPNGDTRHAEPEVDVNAEKSRRHMHLTSRKALSTACRRRARQPECRAKLRKGRGRIAVVLAAIDPIRPSSEVCTEGLLESALGPACDVRARRRLRWKPLGGG